MVGVCNTRALLAELLAIRLLKDFTTRELIDALSYDFDPLSGANQDMNGHASKDISGPSRKKRSALARTSTLEVAIRAHAKKFLSHPAVVQHLEAIWAGSIVFHSASDNLHRLPSRPRINHHRQYGALHNPQQGGPRHHSHQGSTPSPSAPTETIRRSVSLYDPSKSSPLKLSRLRVPRYRQMLSTLSYFVMLCLFIAVLSRRSLSVTPLEVVFWFWSAGFMVDELVEFSEQGFGLYLASVWSTFDIGILILFSLYYVLRILGAIVSDAYEQTMAFMAYDVLAASAVLLFPRLFSLLDHYRYFSQLLIAFRHMAQDLAAVLFLITITCSGFFVAFSMSFGQEDFEGRGVAFALFQILMGFTPAAWDVWDETNALGKMIMALFLIIGHFLIVTILITVLTNSFMTIVKNAHEEHQYLFAINTISSVKSDALFSYVAPTNCLGFILAPLRKCMPFAKYVVLNRTVIKLTHFPMLFAIFFYERYRLAAPGAAPMEHVERRGRPKTRVPTFANGGGIDAFTTTQTLRMPSEATWQKDRALDEVFRQPVSAKTPTRKYQPSVERRKTAVNQWMSIVGDEGGASPPAEEQDSFLDQLEKRRPGLFRSNTSQALRVLTRSKTQSFHSDPDDRRTSSRPSRFSRREEQDSFEIGVDEPAEADDELNSNDDDEPAPSLQGSEREQQKSAVFRSRTSSIKFEESNTPSPIARMRKLGSSPGPVLNSQPPRKPTPRQHNRESSTQTIVFNPLPDNAEGSSPPLSSRRFNNHRRHTRPTSTLMTIPSASHSPPVAVSESQHNRVWSRTGSQLPDSYGAVNKSAPSLATHLSGQNRRRPPSDVLALDLASDIGDNFHHDSAAGMLSSSFQTQFMRGMESMRRRNRDHDNSAVSRMVLSRMNNLEEGFKDILREVKNLRNAGSPSVSMTEDSTAVNPTPKRTVKKKQRNRRTMPEKHAQHLEVEQEDPSEDTSKEVSANVVNPAE